MLPKTNDYRKQKRTIRESPLRRMIKLFCRDRRSTAARSRSCSDSPPDCHSLHSRRFATPTVRKQTLIANKIPHRKTDGVILWANWNLSFIIFIYTTVSDDYFPFTSLFYKTFEAFFELVGTFSCRIYIGNANAFVWLG